MKIVIAGGTGFIGRKLTDILLGFGHEIVILTRRQLPSKRNIQYIRWLQDGLVPENLIGRADVFMNLAGASINEGRWTEQHQKQIYESRMKAANELIRIITALPEKPSVFINASAIGIYPSSEDTVYTETSLEIADDFLGKTVYDWEKNAIRAESLGLRVVLMRFGLVLGREGGALPLMILPYKLFAGGTLGSGKQWVSWVHVTDVVRALIFAMEYEQLHGPVNVTSPSPIKMRDFGKKIGSVLHRPHWFPVPAAVLQLVLGKKSALVLEGQRVLPEELLKKGFEFNFPSLDSALEDLLQ